MIRKLDQIENIEHISKKQKTENVSKESRQQKNFRRTQRFLDLSTFLQNLQREKK